MNLSDERIAFTSGVIAGVSVNNNKSIIDIILMGIIGGGFGYLLNRIFFKKIKPLLPFFLLGSSLNNIINKN